jgi:twitching motility protein PilT
VSALERLVHELLQRDGEALHVVAGSASLRVKGKLARAAEPALDGEVLAAAIAALGGEDTVARARGGAPVDFGCELGGEPLRARCFAHVGGLGLVLRRVPRLVAFDDLGLPPAVKRLALLRRGLVLVSGPRGAGKTTTVAALLREIDATRTKHVVVLESPAELDGALPRTVVCQREVGRHVPTFAAGFEAALRQGAEVIFASDLPDADAIARALEAVAAGVLVLATLRASGVVRTIEQLLARAPARTAATRRGIADSLAAAVSLVQVTTADALGRVVAAEVLLRGPGVASALRDRELTSLHKIMQREDGMQTLDDALASLVKRRVISLEEAFDHAREKQRFRPRPR